MSDYSKPQPIVYDAASTLMRKRWVTTVDASPGSAKLRWLIRRRTKVNLSGVIDCPASQIRLRAYKGARDTNK